MAGRINEDPNEAAFRTLQAVTGRDDVNREPVELDIAIAQLLNADGDWGNVIRTCVEWSEELKSKPGGTGQFTRESVYYRLARPRGEGPKLTPLVKSGVLRNAWTNARGKPYYELAHEPAVILRALQRAALRTS